MRMVEKNIRKAPDNPGFEYVMFDSNWAGNGQYRSVWDPAARAWIAYLKTYHEGKPATERIVDQPSPDGKTIVHIEGLRLDATPSAPYTETFRWTWTKRE